MKRGADHQLTKDDPPSDEESTQEESTQRRASDAVIAGRTIIKARRKGISAPTGVAIPAFNFGATQPTTQTQTQAVATEATNEPVAATAAVAAAPAESSAATTTAAAAAEWSCSLCDTSNPSTATSCSACDEARPADASQSGVAAESAPATAPATAAASEKATEPVESESKPTSSTSASTSEPSSSSVVFGVVSAAAPLSTFASGSTGSVFGSGTSSVFGGDSSASGSSFSFSSTEAPASQLSFGNVPSFSGFGSAAASFQSFGSLAKSDSASFAPSTDKPAFEAAAATNLLATTVETNDEFKDRVQERTGEEDDEVHLRIATKVYQMKEVPVVTEAHPEGEVTAAIAATTGGSAPAAATGTVTGAAAAPAKTVTKYVEIGSGELHVNSVEDQSTHKIRARLVLREDRTKRNVLNAPLFVGMTYKIEGDKFVKFHSLDLEGKMATFLLKFKEKSAAEDLLRALETCIDLIKSQ